MTRRVMSVYIHWPFCPYRCSYCPFVACADHDHLMERYARALIREIDFFSRKNQGEIAIQTIYFGGGTPSTIPSPLLLDMLDILKERFYCAFKLFLNLLPNHVFRYLSHFF